MPPLVTKTKRYPIYWGSRRWRKYSRWKPKASSWPSQRLLIELHEDEVFDVAYIQEIHRRALGRVYGFAGHYRTVNLSKGGFAFPAARYLPNNMADFEREMLRPLPHSWPDDMSLVRDVARVHAELLLLHPFWEGNGRTARVLANLMAYKNGSTSQLPLGSIGRARTF